MTLAEAQSALKKWTASVIKPGLSRTKTLLKLCQHPDKKIPIIQIAGTNGKGSVTAMLSSILTCAGYRTGRFISPHLRHERERICIDQQPISPKIFIKAVSSLLPALKTMAKQGQTVTLFEAWTVLALLVFKQEKVDIAVVETGLGGRFDATTALKRKLLTLITNIQLDHTAFLGSTKQAICFEKMGIIKKGVPLLTSEADPNIRKQIKRLGAIKKVPVFYCGKNKQDHLQIISSKNSSQGLSITLRHPDGHPWTITSPLPGSFQTMNTALAVMAAQWLSALGLKVGDNTIVEGLRHVDWPGRFEKLMDTPPVYLDGGHNLAAIQAVIEALNPKPGQIKLLIGVMKDKAVEEMVDYLVPYVSKVWTFKPSDKKRGLPAKALADLFEQQHKPGYSNRSINQAIQNALKTAQKKDIFLIIGSLYNIAPAKRAIRSRKTVEQK